MAQDSPRHQRSPAELSELLGRGRLLLGRCRRFFVAHVRAASFWLAVVAPWLLLGLTLDGRAADSPGPFAVLFCLAVLSAVLGHNHRR